MSLSSSEININSDQMDSVSDKTTDRYHLPNGNSESITEFNGQNASTPATITIADIDTDDDAPIRFTVCVLVFFNPLLKWIDMFIPIIIALSLYRVVIDLY